MPSFMNVFWGMYLFYLSDKASWSQRTSFSVSLERRSARIQRQGRYLDCESVEGVHEPETVSLS